MLANFFGKSKPINYIIIIGLFLVCLLMTLIKLPWASFDGHLTLNIGEQLILFLSIFFFYNFIVAKNNLTFDNSYAFLTLVLFIGLILQSLLDVKTLLSILLHVLFLRKIYSLKSLKDALQKLFDAGFWLGILFILQPFSIIYLLLIYLSVFLYHKIMIRTILIPIVGVLVPLFLFFTYCFWYDNTTDFYNLFNFTLNYKLVFLLEQPFLMPLILIGSTTMISLLLKSPRALSVNNDFKKSWILLTFHVFISICFVVFVAEKNGSELLFFILPASIVCANGLELIKKTVIKDVLIVTLFSCTILMTLFF